MMKDQTRIKLAHKLSIHQPLDMEDIFVESDSTCSHYSQNCACFYLLIDFIKHSCLPFINFAKYSLRGVFGTAQIQISIWLMYGHGMLTFHNSRQSSVVLELVERFFQHVLRVDLLHSQQVEHHVVGQVEGTV